MSTILKASQPIAKISLADSVYQRILEAILSGALASGMELSEVALAAELGVSRTPVHEALLRLAADGLVEDLSSRQARVASFSRSDIVEIYEVRQILDLRILAALETRDDCEARRAMADHIASRLSSVLSEFDSQAELRRV
jgi:DNA-binding GntR family transcriptional regulator